MKYIRNSFAISGVCGIFRKTQHFILVGVSKTMIAVYVQLLMTYLNFTILLILLEVNKLNKKYELILTLISHNPYLIGLEMGGKCCTSV